METLHLRLRAPHFYPDPRNHSALILSARTCRKGDIRMSYREWLRLALVIFVLLSGCTSVTYKPGLSLEKSPVKIKAKAQVESFVDHSPATDKDRRIGGVSATEPKTLAGDLATEVTNAVINDFLINGVFQEVGKSVDNPDLIVTGEIRKFYGKAGLNSCNYSRDFGSSSRSLPRRHDDLLCSSAR